MEKHTQASGRAWPVGQLADLFSKDLNTTGTFQPRYAIYNLQKCGAFSSVSQGLPSVINLGEKSEQPQKEENGCGWCEG